MLKERREGWKKDIKMSGRESSTFCGGGRERKMKRKERERGLMGSEPNLG